MRLEQEYRERQAGAAQRSGIGVVYLDLDQAPQLKVFPRPEPSAHPPDPLDFPVQGHAQLVLHIGADRFAETFKVGRRGLAGVDHEVGMQGGEHGAAVGFAAPAGLVHQGPCRVAGRVLEGGAAGLFADRWFRAWR